MPYFIDNTATTGAMDLKLLELDSGAPATMRLLSTYTLGDDLATITPNTLASNTLGAGDITGPTASGENRVLTINGPIDLNTATAGDPSPDLHVSVDDGTKVLFVVNCADQPITSGNPVSIGGFTITDNQPVLA